jgi:hypothetical protein
VDPSESGIGDRAESHGIARRSREHWILLALSFASVLMLVLLATWVHPDPRGFGTHEQLGLPACRMIEWTGIPCPGCGVTTSVALFAHGQWLASLHNQPLGFLLALAIPLYAAWAIAGQLMGRDLSRDAQILRANAFVIVLLALVAACWAYKIALVKGWIG